MLPVIIYGAFVVGLAINFGFYFTAFIVCFYLLFLVGSAALLSMAKLKNPEGGKHSKPWFPQFKFSLPSYPGFMYGKFILNELKIPLLITKVMSVLLLLGSLNIYDPAEYDQRVVYLAAVFSIIAHAVICFRVKEFEDQYLQFWKGLPYSFLNRFFQISVFYLLILIPECFLLLNYSFRIELDSFSFISCASFLASALIYFHLSLYQKSLNMEQFLNKVFIVFIALFALVLFKIPAMLLAIGLSVYSFFLLKRYFYLT